METTRKDSLKRLNNRLADLEKASQTYQENLNKSQQDYVAIRDRAEFLNSQRESN